MSTDSSQGDPGDQLGDAGRKALEQERAARRDAEQRARRAETAAAAYRYGIPPELLEGVAADQLEARAKALLDFRGSQGSGQDGAQRGQDGADGAGSDRADQDTGQAASGAQDGTQGATGGQQADSGRSRPVELRPGASPNIDDAVDMSKIADSIFGN